MAVLPGALAKVQDIVTGRPWLRRGLEAFGIDAGRCGGLTLERACQALGHHHETVALTLGRVWNGPEDLKALNPVELVEHIVNWHHRYLRKVLPQLVRQLASVTGRWCRRYPELEGLKKEFQLFVEAAYPHIFREEQVLFGQRPAASSVAVIEALLADHERALVNFTAIRSLMECARRHTNPPREYLDLLTRLDELDDDMRWHMHAENDLLFPRLLRMAQAA